MRLLLFSVVAFSVIFLIGFIQSVAADHLESGTGFFVTESKTNLVTSKNTNYQIYLQLVIRNGDGQLIGIIENNVGGYIPHKITDDKFDYDFGKKEIVTVDNKKYEKVQWTTSGGFTPDEMNKKTKDYSIWKIGYCLDLSDIGHGKRQCLSIFQALLPTITLEPGDVITQKWTILRELGG